VAVWFALQANLPKGISKKINDTARVSFIFGADEEFARLKINLSPARTRSPKQSTGLFLLLRNCPVRISLRSIKITGTPVGCLLFLAQMKRFELLSTR
ncbi:MAG: hypothetical protein ACI4IR_02030, partial [Eubacterium sp.]